MSIAATCAACKKSYDLPDAFGGRRARCKNCGAIMAVPGASASSPVPAHADAGGYDVLTPEADTAPSTSASPHPAAPLAYSNRTLEDRPISKERRLAARSCRALGVFLLLISTCFGMVLLIPLATGTRIASGRGGFILIAFVAFVLAAAITYLVGGQRIGRGGGVSVVVCLVLASLQEFMALLYLASAIVLSVANGVQAIALLVSGLAVAAFGQLIYYLAMVLREGNR